MALSREKYSNTNESFRLLHLRVLSQVMRSAIRNGKLVDESMAVLPVAYREVQYSFSVYESVRVENGRPVHLSDHLERLKASCRMINLEHPFTDDVITSSLESLIEHDNIVYAPCRILIVGGPEPLFFITYTAPESFPESYYENGVPAVLYYGERFLPEAKTSNLLMQYLAAEEAKRKGAFEALLVNRKGEVLEGVRSNVYGLYGNRIYTAADGSVLSGITRISVIKAAEHLGYEIVYTPPTDTNIHMFDSLFISSTPFGIIPISSVNGHEINHIGWEKIRKIHELEREWEKE